jgi:hypothetical protein
VQKTVHVLLDHWLRRGRQHRPQRNVVLASGRNAMPVTLVEHMDHLSADWPS